MTVSEVGEGMKLKKLVRVNGLFFKSVYHFRLECHCAGTFRGVKAPPVLFVESSRIEVQRLITEASRDYRSLGKSLNKHWIIQCSATSAADTQVPLSRSRGLIPAVSALIRLGDGKIAQKNQCKSISFFLAREQKEVRPIGYRLRCKK